MSEARLWAVVLAGGTGSRFWPASTPRRPKQLLTIAGEAPLIAQTVERIAPLVPAERIRLLAGERLGDALLAATPSLAHDALWVEPRARGTAPVLAWAASRIVRADPGGVMVSLHADHVIRPAAAFRDLVAELAAASAAQQRLFTIGAVPDRAETGYGYIQPGAELAGGVGRDVRRFVEKPDRETAGRYIADGYLWNTGLFVWPAALLLAELERHCPELAPLLPLLEAGDDAAFFERAPSLSIDEGLLERSDRVAVARASFAWDDVGAWDALLRTRELDDAGNAVIGEAHLRESERCVVWSEDGAIVAFGVADLVIVHVDGVTLVTRRELAPELKKLVDALPDELRERLHRAAPTARGPAIGG
jgi:mannose-1-phosphate guanylyltransferase